MATEGDVRVLVVDDQVPFLRAAAAVILRTPGFRLVGEALDGAAAVDRVGAQDVDLVLMDVHMPVLDGIAACNEVVRRWPATVVVLVSTYDHDDLPASVRSAGAAAYLHKEELTPSRLTQVWGDATGATGPHSDRSA